MTRNVFSILRSSKLDCNYRVASILEQAARQATKSTAYVGTVTGEFGASYNQQRPPLFEDLGQELFKWEPITKSIF